MRIVDYMKWLIVVNRNIILTSICICQGLVQVMKYKLRF